MEHSSARSIEASSHESDSQQNNGRSSSQRRSRREKWPGRSFTPDTAVFQPIPQTEWQTQNGNLTSQNDLSSRQNRSLPQSSNMYTTTSTSQSKPNQHQSGNSSCWSQRASAPTVKNPPQAIAAREENEVFNYKQLLCNDNVSTVADFSSVKNFEQTGRDIKQQEATTLLSPTYTGNNCQPSVPPSDQQMAQTNSAQQSNLEMLQRAQETFYRYVVREPALLNYVLSLFYHSSQHLIPLRIFFESMNELVVKNSRLFIDDTPVFRRLVAQLMVNLRDRYSPIPSGYSSQSSFLGRSSSQPHTAVNSHGAPFDQYDSNVDYTKWGDFSSIRDQFGRRLELNSSEVNAMFSNESFYYTRFFQASVLELCGKIFHTIDKSRAETVRRNTPVTDDPSEQLYRSEHGASGASYPVSQMTKEPFLSQAHVNNAQRSEIPIKRQERPPTSADNVPINPQIDNSSDAVADHFHVSSTVNGPREQNQIAQEIQPQVHENHTAGQPLQQYSSLARHQAVSAEAASPIEHPPAGPELMGENIRQERSTRNCRCKSFDNFNIIHTQPNGDIVDIRRTPDGEHKVMCKYSTGFKVYCERDSDDYIDVFIKRPSGHVDVFCNDPSGQLHAFFKRPSEKLQDLCPQHACNLDRAHRRFLINYVEKIAGDMEVDADKVLKKPELYYPSDF